MPAALVEVVRHGQAHHWKLAEAAPHDDLSAGSFSGSSTAEGHQGYWVAQQAGALPILGPCCCRHMYDLLYHWGRRAKAKPVMGLLLWVLVCVQVSSFSDIR